MSSIKILKTFKPRAADEWDYDVAFTRWLADIGDAASAEFTVDVPTPLEQYKPAVLDAVTGTVKLWLRGGLADTRYIIQVGLHTAAGRYRQVAFALQVMP